MLKEGKIEQSCESHINTVLSKALQCIIIAYSKLHNQNSLKSWWMCKLEHDYMYDYLKHSCNSS